MVFSNSQSLVDEKALKAIRCVVLKAAKRNWFRSDETEDLIQDCVVNLLQRCHAYDPAKSKWQTFCALVTRNYLYSVRLSRGQSFESLDDHCCQCGGIEEDRSIGRKFLRSRTEYERIEFQEDIETAVDALPDELQKICHLLAEGGVSYVCDVMQVSRSYIYRRREMIRESVCFESLSDYR